jgi:Ca-activated chloride channel family protein
MRGFGRVLAWGALAFGLLVATNPAVPADEPAARVMLILDASGSMWGQVDGKAKILIARDAVRDLTKNWDPNIAIGLMTYGHRSKSDCADIETLVEPTVGAASRVYTMTQKINPKGMTPISAAVRQAADKLKSSGQKSTIILVTDGLETCNADPCALGKSLKDSGVDLKVHIIGFNMGNENTKSIQCLADETGGRYIKADHASELVSALNTVVTEVKKEAVETPPPQPEVRKPASDTIHVFLAPNVAVPDGDVVRFDYLAPGAPNDAKIIGTDYGTVAKPALSPGKYDVRVRLGAVDARFPMEVAADKRADHPFVLNAGIITFDALLGQTVKVQNETIGWRIFKVGTNGAVEAQATAYDYGDVRGFILPAGNYVVTAQLGDAHRSVPFSLAAGEITKKTVDLRAGRIVVNAKYSDTSTPVTETIAWRFFEAKPGERGDAAAYNFGSADTFTLTAGDYVVTYSVSGVKGEAKVTVEPDKEVTKTIVLNAGRVVFESSLAPNGPKLEENSEFWEAKDAKGNSLIYDYRSSPAFLLPAGTVTMNVSIGAVKHSETFTLKPGETIKRRVALNAGYVKYSGTVKGVPATGNPYFGVHPVKNNVRGDAVSYDYRSSGSFLIPAGDYDLELSVNGTKGFKRLTVKPGATVAASVDAK